MHETVNLRTRLASKKPSLTCQELPPFCKENLESVQRAFAHASSCHLGQTWQIKLSPRFAPAVVRTGWQGNSFLVYAALSDQDIFTRVSGLNQRAWELGDAFEIFLRAESHESYVEFQITPDNHRLQLRFANRDALMQARATNSLAGALLAGEVFHSQTWIERHNSRWHVFAEIPAEVVCEQNVPLGGRRWHFSFSRYDYTRGAGEPEISSTSPHAEADFHRQEEWGVMHFCENAHDQTSHTER